MVGTGFTQEGLDLTYPTIDILTEMTWRKEPIENVSKWFEDYSSRRYGRQNQVLLEKQKKNMY
jgi:hypothetical protein